jgi:hypothetical protein
VGDKPLKKWYADIFQRWPITTFSGQRYQLNAIDNAVWSVGEWWSTIQSETGPKFEGGYWSAIYIHEGDDWKIGRLEDPLIGLQRASETDVEAVVIALRSFGGLYSPMFIGFQVVAIPKRRMSLRIDTKN